MRTNGVDACTQPFEHDGVSYQSLTAYCNATIGEDDWGRCERTGLREDMIVYSSYQTTPLFPGTSPNVLVDTFNAQAPRTFGEGGYFAAIIGLHPDSECAPQAGQSLATNLSGIATEGALFSICGDYSGALASVRAFTERLVDSTLELDLAPEENILAVYAEQGDGGRRLIDPMLYTFDRTRGVLELVTGALVAMETGVAVEVENPCVIPPD
jgi:hypothetical protein